jgi:hypothetical protein
MMMRYLTFLLLMVVMLNHVVSGLFIGGTVLCVGCAGSVALQPVGLTSCADNQQSFACTDSCTDTYTKIVDLDGCHTCEFSCQDCTDYALTLLPSNQPKMADYNVYAFSTTVTAIIEWDQQYCTQSLPIAAIDTNRLSLVHLATVVLRC